MSILIKFSSNGKQILLDPESIEHIVESEDNKNICAVHFISGKHLIIDEPIESVHRTIVANILLANVKSS